MLGSKVSSGRSHFVLPVERLRSGRLLSQEQASSVESDVMMFEIGVRRMGRLS